LEEGEMDQTGYLASRDDWELAQKTIERLKDELHQERTLNVTLAKQLEAAAEKCNRLWKLEMLMRLTGFEARQDEG